MYPPNFNVLLESRARQAPAPEMPADAALVWFRRDLRDYDHAALYQALRSHPRVFCAFCFDTEILDALAARAAVQHDQAAAATAEGGVELPDRVPDELDAPVRARGERVEDLGVEAERAVDAPRLLQRVVQGGVVVVAQVAAEPHQGGVVGHGRRW
jgi:DNA photolyase